MDLQITFHGLEHSDALAERIASRARDLERFAPHVVSCDVFVQAGMARHHQGNLFSVHVHVRVPGGEIAASRDPGLNHAHEDANVAVRDAFDATVRQLEDYMRRRRDNKRQERTPRGALLGRRA